MTLKPDTVVAAKPVLDRETLGRGHGMLRGVWDLMKEYYFDSTYRGVDTAAALRVADSAINAASSQAFMLAAVVQFLDNFKDSHTWLIPPEIPLAVDYGWGWRVVGDALYVARVKKGSDAETQGLKVGDRVLAIDRIQPTRDNIRGVSYAYFRLRPRPGMHLAVLHPDGTQSQMTIKSTMKQLRSVWDLDDNTEYHQAVNEDEANAGLLHQIRVFADSVMVWKMAEFPYNDDHIDTYMERARHNKVLILDFRGNPGGYEEGLVRFLGHFTDNRFVAAIGHERHKLDSMIVEPRGRDGAFKGQIMILIDAGSASSAEIMTRTLQIRRSAMVIGDRSAGAVMTAIQPHLELGAGDRRIPYGMSVTVADFIMPDGSRLENVGVVPNVAALPTAEDLAEHRDPAMQFALEMAGIKMNAVAAAKIFSDK